MKRWLRSIAAILVLALIPASEVLAAGDDGRAVVFKGTRVSLLTPDTQLEWPAYEPFNIRHGYICDTTVLGEYRSCQDQDQGTDFFLFDIVNVNGQWRYRRVKAVSGVWDDPDSGKRMVGGYRNFGVGQPPGVRTFCGMWIVYDSDIPDLSVPLLADFTESHCLTMVFTDQSTLPGEQSAMEDLIR